MMISPAVAIGKGHGHGLPKFVQHLQLKVLLPASEAARSAAVAEDSQQFCVSMLAFEAYFGDDGT
jgi:hypothetical protein